MEQFPVAKSRPTYLSLQAARGIAAVLVVFQHVTYWVGTPERYWHREYLVERFQGLRLGVEFFFVLSGTVILLAHQKDIGKRSVVGSYLWKRFRRIYPIHWVILTVWLPLYSALSGHISSDFATPLMLLSDFSLVHIGTLNIDLPVTWTLFHEILFYVCFTLVLLHPRLGKVLLAIWWTGSLVMLFVPASPWFSEYLFSPLHLLFGFGMLAVYLTQNTRVRLPAAWFGSGLLLFISSMVAAATYDSTNIWVVQAAGLGAAALMLGSIALETTGKLSIHKSLLFLGDASYAIYLAHFPIMMFVVKPMFYLWKHQAAPFWLCLVVLAVSGVAGGSLVHIFVERPLLQWLGARSPAAKRTDVT